jgi:glycerol-3-phosphate acyltransferase PlsY
MKNLILVAIIGYLFGNIQASYLLGKWIRKVDIRTLGQGNAGASNAFETLGMKFGMLVGIIDILKAVISILLVKQFFHADLNASSATLLYLNGYCVILGHIFPFYMNFKGGKGIAALIGMSIGLNPWIGMGAFFVIVSVTSITDYISIGSSALTFYMVVVTLCLKLGLLPFLISVAGMCLILFLHLPNYRRIISRKETRVFSFLRGKAGIR